MKSQHNIDSVFMCYIFVSFSNSSTLFTVLTYFSVEMKINVVNAAKYTSGLSI